MLKPRLFYRDGYWRVDRSDPATEFKKLSKKEMLRFNLAYSHTNVLDRDPTYIEMRRLYYENMRIARRQRDTNPKEKSNATSAPVR